MTISKSEFEKLIKNFGPQEKHWPKDQVSLMQNYIKQHPDSKEILHQESKIDQWLDTFEVQSVPAHLKHKILSNINPNNLTFVDLLSPILPKSALLASFLLFGVIFGVLQQQIQEDASFDFQTIASTALNLETSDEEETLL